MRLVYSVPNVDIGVTRSISGKTYSNAEVALKNPGGSYVAFTTADGSGNYSFNIDHNIPLDVVVSSQYDASILSTLSVNSAYGGSSIVRVALKTSSDPAQYWAGTPSISVYDTTGSGFTGTCVMTPVGGQFKDYGSVVTLDNLYGGVGSPIVGIIINNIGEKYSGGLYPSNYRKISGNRVIYAGGAEPTDKPTRWQYDNSWYYSEFHEDVWANNSFYGVVWVRTIDSAGTWFNGVYADIQDATTQPGTPDWCYISSNLPTQNITEPAWDSSLTGQNEINTVKSTVDLSSFYNGKYALAYYSIIYGQDPNNINITGYPGSARSDSAVDAYNRGLISKQELDILKGYFGKELLVGGVLHIVGNQLTNQIVASILLLGYNIAQGVTQTSILQEMRSVWRQGKGVLETDMSGRVRTILTKMQAATGNNYIDNLQVRDANNVIHQWNFTGSAPTSTAL